jgi:hypothetical protein
LINRPLKFLFPKELFIKPKSDLSIDFKGIICYFNEGGLFFLYILCLLFSN